MRVQLEQVSDDWYESEEPTRVGMVAEMQRIRRRTAAHPISVLVVALTLTVGVTYKLATRAQNFEAEVILALTEGSLSAKHNGLPVDELRQFVDGVLIPDAKLRELVERRDLYRLRKKLGMEFALEQLREHIDVQIWKNSFAYYDEDAAHAEHSARIGITVNENDPDLAYELAHDISQIVIETANENRQQLNTQLSSEIEATRAGLSRRVDQLTRSAAEKQSALTRAHGRHEESLAQALNLEVTELDLEAKRAEKELSAIAASRDALADRIAAAGLDTSLTIVEEHRPERPEHKGFLIAMIAVVIGIGALVGTALILGAFDSRIHDGDDVERLGLPVLGHVPGFAGDRVGSLSSRGASRARVPSFARWRSHQ